jgi:hypothetical protein
MSARYVHFCLLWHYSFGTSTVRITTATDRVINSKIVMQSIIESKELLENPESLVTVLSERVNSEIASPVASGLFNSKYAYENDFIKAIFEHIKPMLEEAKVP